VDDDADQRVPRVISSLEGETVQQVVGGYSHSLALTSKGIVYVWGRNWNGQLGTGLLAGRIPVEYPTPQRVCCLENASVIQIAAGSYHSLALTANERVMMWGWNNEGERGNGKGGPQVSCLLGWHRLTRCDGPRLGSEHRTSAGADKAS
jgi:alpha-tubulin suppressor-like RCC1 family protein